jgi:DNA-binding Lrp family transcriptional regulator
MDPLLYVIFDLKVSFLKIKLYYYLINDNMKLDKRDKMILSVMEYDSRTKEKELAKLCHLSKDAIRYRIRKLESQKIITKYTCFVDYTKLGLASYKLYLKIRGSEKDWMALRAFLDGKPNVLVRFEAQSDWNFGIGYFARSLEDYYAFELELFSKFESIIQNSELCHMVDVLFFEPKILVERSSGTFKLFAGVRNTQVDSKDVKLMERLLGDSGSSLLDLAKAIGLSSDSTKKRMRRLEEEGVITRYITLIDHRKLGFEIYKVFISVRDYTGSVEKELVAQLASYRNIRNIIRMVGPWKLEVELICSSYDEFFGILKELRTKFPDNIASLNYAIFRNDTYYPSGRIPI